MLITNTQKIVEAKCSKHNCHVTQNQLKMYKRIIYLWPYRSMNIFKYVNMYMYERNACISSLANLIGLSRLIIQSHSDSPAAVRRSDNSLPQVSRLQQLGLSQMRPFLYSAALPHSHSHSHSSSQLVAICCNVACQLSTCSAFSSLSAGTSY